MQNKKLKHAILILAHKDFNQLCTLIDYFDSCCDLFLHIDKKSTLTRQELKQLSERPGVKGLYRKFSVNWAGFSILRCELFLLKKALQNSKADYFHLISGQDFPIKPQAEFLDFFENKPDTEYLDCRHLPMDNWEEGTYDRFKYFLPNDWINARSEKGEKMIHSIKRWQYKLGIKRRIPDQFDHLYGGSAWFSITRKAVNYLLDYTHSHPAFYRRLNYTFVPEETYVPTVLMNAPFRENIVSDNNYRFVLWSPTHSGSPDNLDERRFYEVATTDAFFARKFNYPSCAKLVSLIQKYLWQKDSFETSPTGAWMHRTFSHYSFDPSLAQELVQFCRYTGVKTVLDLGCGPGWYVTALRRNRIASVGYDGNPHTEELSNLLLGGSKLPCKEVDLTENLHSDVPYDLVLCLAVAEYIPVEYEDQFIRNLVSNTGKYLILSWATPEKKEPSYLNCRPHTYVIDKIQKQGLLPDVFSTNYLKEKVSQPYFKSTLMVFRTYKEN